MDYKELVALARQGRSINETAHALGIPQPTMHRYAKGERIPDFDIGLRIVQAANVDLAEGFLVLAEAQRQYKKGNKVVQEE
jgi:transcriptional regulator with XRE-family HTH domain